MTSLNLREIAKAYPYYPWLYSDAGRRESKRAKAKNDCTVRAFALVMDLKYDAAYDVIAKAGRKSGQGFDLKKLHQLIWIPLPAVKGQKRMTVANFHKQFPAGKYIARKSKHVFAVIDGIVFDDHEPRPDACIYGYFVLREALA